MCRLRNGAFASATALLEGLSECLRAESWGVPIEGGVGDYICVEEVA
jgi:hypothetical protein